MPLEALAALFERAAWVPEQALAFNADIGVVLPNQVNWVNCHIVQCKGIQETIERQGHYRIGFYRAFAQHWASLVVPTLVALCDEESGIWFGFMAHEQFATYAKLPKGADENDARYQALRLHPECVFLRPRRLGVEDALTTERLNQFIENHAHFVSSFGLIATETCFQSSVDGPPNSIDGAMQGRFIEQFEGGFRLQSEARRMIIHQIVDVLQRFPSDSSFDGVMSNVFTIAARVAMGHDARPISSLSAQERSDTIPAGEYLINFFKAELCEHLWKNWTYSRPTSPETAVWDNEFDPNVKLRSPGRVYGCAANFPDPQDLFDEFNPITFLDLCAGIEAAVLHDEIVVHSDVVACANNNSLLRGLISRGIVRTRSRCTIDYDKNWDIIRSTPNADRTLRVLHGIMDRGINDNHDAIVRLYGTDAIHHVKEVKRAEGNAFVYGTQYLDAIQMNEIYDVAIVLDKKLTPLYTSLPGVECADSAARKVQALLAEKYAALADELHVLRRNASRTDVIFLPPIALEVLEESQSIDDLPGAIELVRHRYERTRNYLKEIDSVLDSDSPLQQKLTYRAKLQNALWLLHPDGEATDVKTTFAREVNEMLNSDTLLDRSWGPDLLRTRVIIDWVLKNIHRSVLRFGLQPLHATRKKWLSVENTTLMSATKQLFGRSINNSDMMLVERFDKTMQVLSRESSETWRIPIPEDVFERPQQ